MSKETPKYGPRLTSAEYDRRVTRIHYQAADEVGMGSKEALNRRVREIEMDLEIDRQLGVDFPREQREAVRRVRERVAAEQRRLSIRPLVRWLTGRGYAEELQALVNRAMAELREELDPEDVMRLLGIEDLEDVALPIDPERIDVEREEG
jgi:hypothetical protein